jgi:hypothetical protein
MIGCIERRNFACKVRRTTGQESFNDRETGSIFSENYRSRRRPVKNLITIHTVPVVHPILHFSDVFPLTTYDFEIIRLPFEALCTSLEVW